MTTQELAREVAKSKQELAIHNGPSGKNAQMAQAALRRAAVPSAPQPQTPRPTPTPTNRPFASLGEQAQAIYRAAMTPGQVDPRLMQQRASGLSEQLPADGGFLISSEFVPEIITKTYAVGEFLSRTSSYHTTRPSVNGIKIPGIDEASRADGSRYGGISSHWQAESSTISTSQPKFRAIELTLRKVTCLVVATDELIADASLLTTFLGNGIPQELSFRLEAALIAGSGTTQPLGILNAPATITVQKETGQAAGTVNSTNILNMMKRSYGPGRAKSVWICNPALESQLFTLSLPIGTAGSALPLYQFSNDPDATPFGTLCGRPVLLSEYASAVGSAGDLCLVDPSQIVTVDKGEPQQDISMDVKFLTDEGMFRVVYRVDGAPSWNAALTPFNDSTTVSPYVVLGPR